MTASDVLITIGVLVCAIVLARVGADAEDEPPTKLETLRKLLGK